MTTPRTSGQSTAPRTTTISFVGDILLAAGVGRVAAAHGTTHLFAGVTGLLQSDDLTIGNLECAVSLRGVPARKTYTFRANPRLLPGLYASGINAVSLANNHALDYGRDALLDTLIHLQRSGITFAGAGRTLDEAAQPVFVTAGGHAVAFLAASRVLPNTGWQAGRNRPGLAQAYNATRVLTEIGNARKSAEIVVVYLHWGVEKAISPEQYQRTLAYQCIDAGADVVIGSHPHVLQGFEYYRGKLIAYSLGNFVFTNHGNATAILQTIFRDGALQTVQVIPCRITRYCPSVCATAKDCTIILQALQQRSYNVRIADDGTLTPVK